MRWLALLPLLILFSCKEKDPWEGRADIPEKISFNRHIRPILARDCLSCHGPEVQKGGLRLDRSSQMASITTDNSPKKSLLWEKIEANHPTALSEREKALLWRWIKQGLPEEGHWATLPIAGKVHASLLDPLILAQPDEARWFARALFGRELDESEITEFLSDSPSREALLDKLMSGEEFANALETRLLLLSGIRPPSPDSAFAPYMRWLDSQVSDPELALDEFFTRSLAGDLLPDAGQEGQIATAWLRMPRTSNGRPLPASIARGFLGLDLSEEHPSLWPDAPEVLPLFFPESLPAEDGPYAVPPFLPIQTPRNLTEIAKLDEAAHLIAKNLVLARQNVPEEFAEWIASENPATPIPDLMAAFTFDEESPVDSSPEGARILEGDFRIVPGINGSAVTAPCEFTGMSLSAGTPFTLSFFLRLPSVPEKPTVVLAGAESGEQPIGPRFTVSSSGLTFGIYGGTATHAIAVASPVLPTPGEWHHYAISYDGGLDASGFRIIVDNRVMDLTVIRNFLYGPPSTPNLLFRFPLPDAAIEELYLHQRVLHPLEVAQLRDGQSLSAAVHDEFPNENQLLSYYQASINPTCRTLAGDLQAIQSRLVSLQQEASKVPVAPDWPEIEPRPTLPFAPLSLETGANRLGFARWLFARENTVTPRVLANRLYLSIHGDSLLPKPNNIADPWLVPLQPELLDHLAGVLVDSDWNVRKLIKAILLNPPSGHQIAGLPDSQ